MIINYSVSRFATRLKKSTSKKLFFNELVKIFQDFSNDDLELKLVRPHEEKSVSHMTLQPRSTFKYRVLFSAFQTVSKGVRLIAVYAKSKASFTCISELQLMFVCSSEPDFLIS